MLEQRPELRTGGQQRERCPSFGRRFDVEADGAVIGAEAGEPRRRRAVAEQYGRITVDRRQSGQPPVRDGTQVQAVGGDGLVAGAVLQEQAVAARVGAQQRVIAAAATVHVAQGDRAGQGIDVAGVARAVCVLVVLVGVHRQRAVVDGIGARIEVGVVAVGPRALLELFRIRQPIAVAVGRGVGGIPFVQTVASLPGVGHPVVVVVGIGVVADAVAIEVGLLGRVAREHVGAVDDAVAVRIAVRVRRQLVGLRVADHAIVIVLGGRRHGHDGDGAVLGDGAVADHLDADAGLLTRRDGSDGAIHLPPGRAAVDACRTAGDADDAEGAHFQAGTELRSERDAGGLEHGAHVVRLEVVDGEQDGEGLAVDDGRDHLGAEFAILGRRVVGDDDGLADHGFYGQRARCQRGDVRIGTARERRDTGNVARAHRHRLRAGREISGLVHQHGAAVGGLHEGRFALGCHLARGQRPAARERLARTPVDAVDVPVGEVHVADPGLELDLESCPVALVEAGELDDRRVVDWRHLDGGGHGFRAHAAVVHAEFEGLGTEGVRGRCVDEVRAVVGAGGRYRPVLRLLFYGELQVRLVVGIGVEGRQAELERRVLRGLEGLALRRHRRAEVAGDVHGDRGLVACRQAVADGEAEGIGALEALVRLIGHPRRLGGLQGVVVEIRDRRSLEHVQQVAVAVEYVEELPIGAHVLRVAEVTQHKAAAVALGLRLAGKETVRREALYPQVIVIGDVEHVVGVDGDAAGRVELAGRRAGRFADGAAFRGAGIAVAAPGDLVAGARVGQIPITAAHPADELAGREVGAAVVVAHDRAGRKLVDAVIIEVGDVEIALRVDGEVLAGEPARLQLAHAGDAAEHRGGVARPDVPQVVGGQRVPAVGHVQHVVLVRHHRGQPLGREQAVGVGEGGIHVDAVHRAGLQIRVAAAHRLGAGVHGDAPVVNGAVAPDRQRVRSDRTRVDLGVELELPVLVLYEARDTVLALDPAGRLAAGEVLVAHVGDAVVVDGHIEGVRDEVGRRHVVVWIGGALGVQEGVQFLLGQAEGVFDPVVLDEIGEQRRHEETVRRRFGNAEGQLVVAARDEIAVRRGELDLDRREGTRGHGLRIGRRGRVAARRLQGDPLVLGGRVAGGIGRPPGDERPGIGLECARGIALDGGPHVGEIEYRRPADIQRRGAVRLHDPTRRRQYDGRQRILHPHSLHELRLVEAPVDVHGTVVAGGPRDLGDLAHGHESRAGVIDDRPPVAGVAHVETVAQLRDMVAQVLAADLGGLDCELAPARLEHRHRRVEDAEGLGALVEDSLAGRRCRHAVHQEPVDAECGALDAEFDAEFDDGFHGLAPCRRCLQADDGLARGRLDDLGQQQVPGRIVQQRHDQGLAPPAQRVGSHRQRDRAVQHLVATEYADGHVRIGMEHVGGAEHVRPHEVILVVDHEPEIVLPRLAGGAADGEGIAAAVDRCRCVADGVRRAQHRRHVLQAEIGRIGDVAGVQADHGIG